MDLDTSGTSPPFFTAARMHMMSLAQRVRDYRYSKGWGPDELASRAAISRTALYQIESGKTELPRAGTLRRIAIALEVSMDSLLGHGETARSSQAGSSATATARRCGETAANGSRPREDRSPSCPPEPLRLKWRTMPGSRSRRPPLKNPASLRAASFTGNFTNYSPLHSGTGSRIVEESHRLLSQSRASS